VVRNHADNSCLGGATFGRFHLGLIKALYE